MKSRGRGPAALLIHGSATDRSTWAIQLASLANDLHMFAPTRPGADGSVVAVEEQAAFLFDALDGEGVSSVVAVGSSFGAIVALEMARWRPERVRGMVLIEPPMAPSDSVASVPDGFGCRFDAVCRLRGGEAAAEMFLRLVLTDEAFERMPQAFRQRSMATWRHIRADSLALARYRPRYAELRRCRVPALLLGGARSPDLYEQTLEALAAALPAARRATVPGAGHMLHAEAPRHFHRLTLEFIQSLPP